MMQEEYSGAIYIIGPNRQDHYEKELEYLYSKFKKVIVIGDGESDILDSNNEGPLQKLNTLSQDYPELLNEGKLLVYIGIHGIAEYDGHYLQVNEGEKPFASKKIFEQLAENIKKPIDIIFTPCEGKAALKDISSLPVGSKIIMFSDANNPTFTNNIESVLEALRSDNFTLDGFYNNYLARVFSIDESPTISTVGEGSIDPAIISVNYFGKTISKTSRQYIHNHFAQNVCSKDVSCNNKIDYLMNKIEQISSIKELKESTKKNYFKALYEWKHITDEYSFIRNTHHNKAVIYNFKESEHCYVELLDLKNKAALLFLEHEIALDLDLAAEYWYEIDYDISGDDTLDDFKEHSDMGIYQTIKDFGCTENNEFLKPEYEEYGLALGIIKDIHLSLSSAGLG